VLDAQFGVLGRQNIAIADDRNFHAPEPYPN
jgi:hypothetical protein